MKSPLRVGIDARLVDGTAGGVQQALIGLADGLAQLPDGDEEYFFLTYLDGGDWLRPFARGSCRIVEGGARAPSMGTQSGLRRIPGARWVWNDLVPLVDRRRPPAPASDGTFEALGVDVVHFAKQGAFVTSLPSIYQPHDLQHRHLPELFSRRERRWRNTLHGEYCERAEIVTAMTHWSARDFVAQLGISPHKVRVIPWASVAERYREPDDDELQSMRARLALPEPFLFYPATPWPHKNHRVLLEALAELRDAGLIVPLVCSGGRTRQSAWLEQHAIDLGLGGQVQFVGFVDPTELQGLYTLARAVVLPSRFEGFGLPAIEAIAASKPLACSNVTGLPELVADAAVLFDPNERGAIAHAISAVWTDEELRAELVAATRRRAADFDWASTARAYRSLYRQIAGRPLGDDDREWLMAMSLTDAHLTKEPT
jgi:glycosyltransferase involved in cell wall biosynthesis